MAKLETVTFAAENDAQVPQETQNYTYVNGLYGYEVTPQFLSAKDNVHHSPAELMRAEQAYHEHQTLRFFRMP